jgi:molybdopterin synthase sulfur carrier subunit
MEVRFYATLRDIVGGRSVEVDLGPGAVVRDLLARLFEQYPALEPRVVDEAGELRHAVNIFVNGRSVRFLGGLDTELQSQDELTIFPPVAGG